MKTNEALDDPSFLDPVDDTSRNDCCDRYARVYTNKEAEFNVTLYVLLYWGNWPDMLLVLSGKDAFTVLKANWKSRIFILKVWS